MNVLFVVPGDEENTSTRHRILNLLPHLENEDIKYDVVSLTESESKFLEFDILGKIHFPMKALIKSPFYDIVYIHRIAFPKTYFRIFNQISNKIVFDFDDAIYTAAHWNKVGSKKRERLNYILKNSSLVIAGSPILAQYAEEFASDIYVLPTPLQREKYENRMEQGEKETQKVKIGWIGNTPNLRYLDEISEELNEILDSYEEVELRIITGPEREHPVTPFRDRLGNDVEYVEWSLEKQIEYLSECDIAVRPLRDDEWCRGKGGYTSVVQCMALEIPVVVTPVGLLNEIVEDGETGFHATTQEEWVDNISKLIEDENLRKRMGDKAFDKIDEIGLWDDNYAKEIIKVLSEI